MNPKNGARMNTIFGVAIILMIGTGLCSHFEAGGTIGATIVKYDNFIGIIAMSVALIFLNRGLRRQREADAEKQRLSSLVQHSRDIIAISGLNRKLEYINPYGREALGLENEEDFLGKSAVLLYSPADNEIIKSVVLPALQSTGAWAGEMCLRNSRTEELIPVEMNTFALYHNETNALIGYATVSKDLRNEKTLQKNLDRFFDVSLDMLAIANTKGYFLRLNPAFSEILGFTEAELCARPCVDFIHPDDIGPTMLELERQMKGESVLSFENRYRTKSGDYRWFSWKSMPDGELTYGAARDITEEKAQKALMEQLSHNAVAASNAKSEFLANMSHEIRTPINGVIGMTELLMDTELDAEQRDYADNVRGSAQSLLTVINDILDFSKVEAGKLDIEMVDFNLETLIEETTKNISWALKNKSVPLEVVYERGTTHLYRGDPGRIRQVLMNLLSNAAKFTERGTVRLTVKALRSNAEVTEFIFEVKDSGIGISPEGQKKLFQPFSQTDASTSRKFGGTGLGLSISHRLVKLMAGDIGVTSAAGEGSTFWFMLPLKNSTVATLTQPRSGAARKSEFAGASILVAEDNLINQKILLSMLAKIGLKAQAVANGKEVLALLRDRSFDLILMDCQMPELDGYETTKRIRESQSLANVNIPIVAMTANALKGDREKCLAAGMDDYATKPIVIEELTRVIDLWLKKAEKKIAS